MYAIQKGQESKLLLLNEDTYQCFEAFLMPTGYLQVPSRRMVWELQTDCHNHLISENIRRDTTDAWVHLLHFCDNQEIDEDTFYKLRPIFDQLNTSSHWFDPYNEGKYSVDEIMCPYFRKHSCKQFIKGKPV